MELTQNNLQALRIFDLNRLLISGRIKISIILWHSSDTENSLLLPKEPLGVLTFLIFQACSS